MQKLIRDIAPGIQFMYQDVLYERIPTERVSCCTRLTAKRVDNDEKVKLKENITVEVME